MTPSYITPHSTLQRLPSDLPPSVDLEDLISHPDSQARQGLIAMRLLQNHLAAMPSGQGPRGAHVSLYQRISPTTSRSTRLQTRTLDYIFPPSAHI